ANPNCANSGRGQGDQEHHRERGGPGGAGRQGLPLLESLWRRCQEPLVRPSLHSQTFLSFSRSHADSVRELDTVRGKMLIVHLVVNVKDAMGANSVNSMAEGIAPRLEELSGATTSFHSLYITLSII